MKYKFVEIWTTRLFQLFLFLTNPEIIPEKNPKRSHNLNYSGSKKIPNIKWKIPSETFQDLTALFPKQTPKSIAMYLESILNYISIKFN
jgi:hypothetical protein